MIPRYLPGREYDALRAATRRLVRKCGGNHGATITRVGQQALSRYGADEPHADGKTLFMPLDIAADLEADLEVPVITRALADLAGCILVPLPKGSRSGRLELAAGATAKEFGEAMVALGAALQDGEITPAEAGKILTEIREAITALAGLAESVRAEAADGRGEQ